jgi:hypothetical protein
MVCRRPAELERHYEENHYMKIYTPVDQRDPKCGYGLCSGAKVAFTRKEYFITHLRDYHKEDIYGGVKLFKSADNWLTDRIINATWWRCARCLKKVLVGSDGWECPDCKVACESERRERREKMLTLAKEVE